MGGLSFLLVQVLGTVSCELLMMQDLLSPALSPAALLAPLPAPRANQSVTAGDLGQALSTMHFHRSMMNEYLCHNYLADEILTELNPLESRSGDPAGPEDEYPDRRARPKNSHGQDQLLTDPGSALYQNWLERSAQLEEMYGKGGKGVSQEGYETGEVTGYATVQDGKEGEGYNYPVPSEFKPPQEGAWNSGGGAWNTGGGGWGDSASGWGDSEWHDNSGSGVSGWGWDEHGTGIKGLALKQLFDLALTALAFLAFGLFVLNLIMTIFARPANMRLVVNATTTPPFRSKRELQAQHQLNELAFRVLTSVDKLLELQEQPSHTQNGCLEYTLCDNNKYSRALNDKNKIWLPVWSLAMSWMAGRQRGMSRLDHIRASVLGLGDADCTALYPQCARTRHGQS